MILSTIAAAEIIPEVMHNLLFVNKKLNPLTITDAINPIVIRTIAKKAIKLAPRASTAKTSATIETVVAATLIIKQIIGKILFIQLL